MLVTVSPVLGLAAFVSAHVAISHAFSRRGMLFRALSGFGMGAFVMVLTSTAAPLGVAILNALTYLALGFGYFNFVNLGFTSVRVRLLRELLDCHPGGMTRPEIVKKYGATEILGARLDRLTSTGQLIRTQDRYYTGKRGVLLIARVFDLLRWLVRGRG